ncbi:hypothetical protein ACH3VR_06145 [Microbacterium sp. B2969]|uniref:Secreted protein n=1 Tax=Microbacterium alkaliflavum TaxID=3248839 RepID=A0ABW7Q5C6_9MICO
MDPVAAVIVVAALATTGVLIALAPAMKRDHRRRQLAGRAVSGGLGSGLDAVWRPSAEEAHREWEAQVEVPAPAPSPGDKGRMEDGRIVIDVHDAR